MRSSARRSCRYANEHTDRRTSPTRAGLASYILTVSIPRPVRMAIRFWLIPSAVRICPGDCSSVILTTIVACT